jgi:SAM-dependent methyltransferase
MKTDSTPQVSFSHYGGKPPENYERYFVPTIGAAWATALLEVSGLSSGERVLDVACGTGIVTRRASELVGPEGFVAGLDVNPAMLAVARSVSPTSIEWHESSAESIPCPDASFDVVTSHWACSLCRTDLRPCARSDVSSPTADASRSGLQVRSPRPSRSWRRPLLVT